MLQKLLSPQECGGYKEYIDKCRLSIIFAKIEDSLQKPQLIISGDHAIHQYGSPIGELVDHLQAGALSAFFAFFILY
jgi:hypothetical protein